MTNAMLIGAIADDPTRATDLALMLASQGMKTVLYFGVPSEGANFGGAEAVVVALMASTITTDEAVAMALASVMALREGGAQQFMFNHGPNFNWAERGNIGPVIESLMELLEVSIVLACPAFPAQQLSVYQGHLFVGSMLVSESPTLDHALTPMRDANLVRMLQSQASTPVGLIPLDIILAGPDAIKAVLSRARRAGFGLMIADAVRDADLRVLGTALAGARLVTGSTGIAMGLPENFRRQGLVGPLSTAERMAAPRGKAIVLVGCGSATTRDQVLMAIEAGRPALRIVPAAVAAGVQTVADVANWVLANIGNQAALVYFSDEPDAVDATPKPLGEAEAQLVAEQLMANLAVILRDNGFSRFIVAGEKTATAVVAALGIKALEIGPQIAPGVHWTRAVGSPELVLAVKPDDLAQPDFFLTAWSLLDD